MRKKRKIKIREIERDFFFNKKKIKKITNYIMKDGKKNKAEKIIYTSLSYIRNKYKKNPYEVFKICIKNTKPVISIKRKKVGGVYFNIPIKLRKKKGYYIACKNIITNSKKKKYTFVKSFAEEIYNSYLGISESVSNRDNIHKTAETNRAFAHFLY
ncbi:hypothetical protein [Candidatus Vidania fulgoroideorum]